MKTGHFHDMPQTMAADYPNHKWCSIAAKIALQYQYQLDLIEMMILVLVFLLPPFQCQNQFVAVNPHHPKESSSRKNRNENIMFATPGQDNDEPYMLSQAVYVYNEKLEKNSYQFL